jgi:hypothetical protein
LAAIDTSRPALARAIDTLNGCYGKNTVYFGGAQAALDSAPTRIAFTNIPVPEKERVILRACGLAAEGDAADEVE